MPSKPEDVLMVKLPRTLAARLREHAASWGAQYERGNHVPAPADGAIPYPLPYIIEVLLVRDIKHRNRGRKHKKLAPYQG